jgi:hypothetical protein
LVVEYRKATESDIADILEHIRKENVDEISLVGLEAKDVLSWSFDNSAESYVAVFDGDPVSAFGIIQAAGSEVGIPWMIGTSTIDRHAVAFLRASKKVIAELSERWPVMMNVADPRNTRGIRWLEFMGFTVYPAEQLPGGKIYRKFEKRS